jgi:DnaJ family protein A protein 5
MEKENKKLRDLAKRKYNDTIKALVEYIRKRDKRVIKHQVRRADTYQT